MNVWLCVNVHVHWHGVANEPLTKRGLHINEWHLCDISNQKPTSRHSWCVCVYRQMWVKTREVKARGWSGDGGREKTQFIVSGINAHQNDRWEKYVISRWRLFSCVHIVRRVSEWVAQFIHHISIFHIYTKKCTKPKRHTANYDDDIVVVAAAIVCWYSFWRFCQNVAAACVASEVADVETVR